ncbi:MAG TPA: GntR family transcriptional regulator [Spirochaetota bacterium]|nr:GntR family transcriptional regulator [Spirochaetota bacterium]HOL57912.1 GntR family transcriptional regulator [Spirochaetota bacterium]HPP04774.1 GntR family transcriptional regulator [Spirochaetota bacterium]
MNFELDYKSGIPFYRQIIQQIEYNINIGKLKPGDRLPTVRSLAIQLKINPNTVAKAYNELEIKGFLITQVGNGTFVSEKKVDNSEIERERVINQFISEIIKKAKDLGLNKIDLINILKEREDV